MIDTQQIAQELTGTIGLYPGLNAGGFLPAAMHRTPVAYLSDAHKLLRPEIIDALGTNLSVVNPAPYVENMRYFKYEVVSGPAPGEYYESLVDRNTAELSDTNSWQQTTLLSAWFSRIERGAITKLCLLTTSTPPPVPLLLEQALYMSEGNSRDTMNKSGRFVGLRLSVGQGSISSKILRVGLQVTGPIDRLPVYLYHSTQDEPVGVVYLTGSTNGRTVWADFAKTLFSQKGGYYMIGYYENDLPAGVFAVSSLRMFNPTGCSSCNSVDYALATNRKDYLKIQPFYINGPGLTPGTMSWTQDDELQIASQSFGLNLIISAQCDATNDILRNRDALVNALLYMIGCDVLEELSTTDRLNGLAAKMNSQAYVALNGQDGNKEEGLKADRNKAVKDLQAMFALLNPNCLSKPIQRGIEFTDVWS